MKKIKLLTILCMFFAGISVASACEIDLKIDGDVKDVYQVGDELVIEVTLDFTHRTCPVSVKDTKFKYQGLKVIGATDWKKVSDMEYTRKLKVKIINVKKGEKTFVTATRTCDKEGGLGSIQIKRA